jgi:endonuclease/exonuclease/phosphatase (EEP) superfamily protein YafD
LAWSRAVWSGDLLLGVVGWGLVAVLGWLTLTRFFDLTVPVRVTVLLQAVLPIVFLPVYLVGVMAFVRKRWFLGGACVLLVIVHLAAVYPALGHRSLPAWAAQAPRITILESNVYDENATPAKAAATIIGSRADVLALVELSNDVLAALRAEGLDRIYPYSTVPAGVSRSDGVWSKTPIDDVRFADGRGGMPMATVDVGGGAITVAAVHVRNATSSRSLWYGDFAEITNQVAAVSGPIALVGDFNATRWNPPFGRLLDSGFHDAHEAVGQGLSRSWPMVGLPWPVMRLDHALVKDGVGVVSVRDVTIPGSDHRGFVAVLAVDT